MKSRLSMKEKLLTNIEVKESGCWEWQLSRMHYGYGSFWWKIRNYGAHRISAHIYLGLDLSSSSYVCHSCDNPPCCNPEHLFIGDARLNSLDMVRKGRGRNALGESEVLEIVKKYKAGKSQLSLAREYKVSRKTIYNIVSFTKRRNASGLSGPILRDGNQRKFSKEEVREIRGKYKPGKYGHKRLAKEYGVHKATIKGILTGKNYRDI